MSRRRLAGNLLEELPPAAADEHCEALVDTPGFRIERIVSHGQASDDEFWYDQPHDEWVVVIDGRARLELAAPPESLELEAGDWVFLPAHCRHRVAWTDPERPTVWLAVHGGAGA